MRGLKEGENVLGPFALDDTPGQETFLLLASGSPRTLDEFRRAVAEAADRSRGPLPPAGHGAQLEAVLARLRGNGGLTVEAASFEHLAR